MGSTYSGDPGEDRHHLIFISFDHTKKIHTVFCPNSGLTRSFRDVVGPRFWVDSHGQVV